MEKYISKISGPLVDRIDIHIEVPAVPFRELSGGAPGTSSAEMRRQVMAARAIQSERFRGSPTRYNGDMTHRQIRQFCKLDEEGMNMLRTRWPRWVSRHALTTRSSAPRAPSPTSTPAPRSAPIISARRSITGCWIGTCGRNLQAWRNEEMKRGPREG